MSCFSLVGVAEILLLYCCVIHFSLAVTGNEGQEEMSLKNVTVLYLKRWQYAYRQRTAPVLQMGCVGGSAGCSPSIQPEGFKCENHGDPKKWYCLYDISYNYNITSYEVNCERCRKNTDDDCVFKDSCRVLYEVDFITDYDIYTNIVSYYRSHVILVSWCFRVIKEHLINALLAGYNEFFKHLANNRH